MSLIVSKKDFLSLECAKKYPFLYALRVFVPSFVPVETFVIILIYLELANLKVPDDLPELYVTSEGVEK